MYILMQCCSIQIENVPMSVCMILCVNNINVIFIPSKFMVFFSNLLQPFNFHDACNLKFSKILVFLL
jgi:hypothetical protein